jgi:hypothetical protein
VIEGATVKLKDALIQESSKQSLPGPRCTVGQLLGRLDAEDADALRAAIDSDMLLEHIAAAIRATGVQMSAMTVSRHRRGRCLCDG